MPIHPLPLRHWNRQSNVVKSSTRTSPTVITGRVRLAEVPVTIEFYGATSQPQTLTELLATSANPTLRLTAPNA